jgi:hypothetical protein
LSAGHPVSARAVPEPLVGVRALLRGVRAHFPGSEHIPGSERVPGSEHVFPGVRACFPRGSEPLLPEALNLLYTATIS